MRRALALRSVRALGIALGAWVPDYFRQPKTGMPKRLEALASERLLTRVAVEGFAGPAYVHPDRLDLLEEAASGKREPRLTVLLSPFDPLVWDRQRARDLFDFDYMIECYTPAPKRRYGYFTLPILHQGKIVGRLDPKAHRDKGVFEVKSIHLEMGVKPDNALATGLSDVLRRLANWHDTPELVIGTSNPPRVSGMLREALKG